ncbi:hypothetical protein OG21DRAFT_1479817 [Imleria badia]|nr:hypothetical protein OG21DRAFT_1479817 [Imleria badia]
MSAFLMRVDMMSKDVLPLNVIVISLGTNVIKSRTAREPSSLELAEEYLPVTILVHRLQDGVDNIALGSLLQINAANTVKGCYFFAAPYPIFVDQTKSARALTRSGRASIRRKAICVRIRPEIGFVDTDVTGWCDQDCENLRNIAPKDRMESQLEG